MLHELHCMARHLTPDPQAPAASLVAAGLSPASAPRARPVTSALHHSFAFSRTLFFAAVLCSCTALLALGTGRARERARARPAVARGRALRPYAPIAALGDVTSFPCLVVPVPHVLS
jgi:hypothetical protein